ncbi:451L [Invertebrate iridescent virus 6]|uniref:Uncharacterized protein 451L n=1 Tax=Invertebrate iridescent virus 6 TaxID=176652 RepID=451L_IIV6|nr:451L [Invertebrate iridescent virus 6]Q91F75.1 RecName: Full=Uncharacterized protein 451L [Invertebrate iridescent virus 6]AAK82311.1 451L [Invertebrate iridescent virus 6]QMS79360.1 hypothetical protein IIV6-T1_441 [Invertebrate iridescent virus 6]
MNKIYVKKGDKNTQVGDKIDEIEVTFRCKGGPIGEVGTFFGKVVSKILFAKSLYTICEKGKIKKIKKTIELEKSDIDAIMLLFSDEDFNPDDSDDLQIDEPDCNGTWTLIKIISVYTPIDEKDNYDFYV